MKSGCSSRWTENTAASRTFLLARSGDELRVGTICYGVRTGAVAHPFHFRVKILKRDARRLTKAVVHFVFLFCGGRGAKWSGPPGAREAQIRRQKCEDLALHEFLWDSYLKLSHIFNWNVPSDQRCEGSFCRYCPRSYRA